MKTGFTMIELLVVLIIIGILVSLNMGNFSRSSEKNMAKEAKANLQLIYAA
ncbi:MAG: type II secretion system protein [Candidatus Omnitrophota bacterium]